MEHRVLHMSVHCRAGMHESTRKSTRCRRQLCCTDYIFIIRFYSSYICHLKFLKTTTSRTLRLHLKIDFDTDLASNITRHSCTISTELVVSSFINNWNLLSFRCILGFFFVFVCLSAAVYGVIKNNNLVRLSSIVPFHIIYQLNLYWRNNSAHKYNYFQTLFHTLALHTNFSRIFHPCNLVPHFHVSHFQSPHQHSLFRERAIFRGDIER